MRAMARKVTLSKRDLHDATNAMKRGWRQGKLKAAGLSFVAARSRRQKPRSPLRKGSSLRSSGPVWIDRPIYQLSRVYGYFMEQQGKAYTPAMSRYLERQRNLCLAIARRAHRISRQTLNNQVLTMMERGEAL
jgi:hypothetical protein